MNRQRAAQLRISALLMQQGLFVVLALVVTLVGGQQYQLWQLSQQPEVPRVSIQHAPQTHFSAFSNPVADITPMKLMDVDQAQPAVETSRQERWVF